MSCSAPVTGGAQVGTMSEPLGGTGGRRRTHRTAKVRIPVHSGELGKFGYSTHVAQKTRRNALRKAVGAYGPLSVFRKLNAVGTLTKRTSKQSSHKFIKDRNWIRKNYM